MKYFLSQIEKSANFIISFCKYGKTCRGVIRACDSTSQKPSANFIEKYSVICIPQNNPKITLDNFPPYFVV